MVRRAAMFCCLAAALAGSGKNRAAGQISLAQTISDDEVIWSPNASEALPPAAAIEEAYGEPAATAGGTCLACEAGGGRPYNRCGCNQGLFPWIHGPGACDQWCVGPHWDVVVDGLVWFRDEVDWAPVIADVGVAPDFADPFDHGAGVRISATGYNDQNFGLQVVYEGINQFNALATFPLANADRNFTYQSRINSLEVNFLQRNDWPLRPMAGVRFVELADDFVDATIVDKPIPAPANPPAAPAAFIDVTDAVVLNNRLIGFQAGLLRDAWRLNRRFSIEPYANAGVYCNIFSRRDVSVTTTTIIQGDDLNTVGNEFLQSETRNRSSVRRDFTEIAFLYEAGLSAVTRLSNCVALRGGYQVLGVNGVGQGIDAAFASGFVDSSLLMHGFFFGLEYQR